MPVYRYRTEILVGPWRESRAEAERDAVAAGQAMPDPEAEAGIVWRLPGEIEEKDQAG
jgi:hypothetical protein